MEFFKKLKLVKAHRETDMLINHRARRTARFKVCFWIAAPPTAAARFSCKMHTNLLKATASFICLTLCTKQPSVTFFLHFPRYANLWAVMKHEPDELLTFIIKLVSDH